MVCSRCSKKLHKLATPGVFKKGDKKEKRKVGENMLLKNRKALKTKFFNKCKNCQKSIGSHNKYCNLCGYKEGRCTMCGIKILKTKFYRQTNV